jgi:hypothetical protein
MAAEIKEALIRDGSWLVIVHTCIFSRKMSVNGSIVTEGVSGSSDDA